MKRRNFLSGVIGTIAGISGSAIAQVTAPTPAPQPPTKLCRIRPNIASMTSAQIDTLKTGIKVMMSRPANDPTSWSYQAAIHGTLVSPTLPLWNQCQHGTDQFLSWHRLFLYRFETILRKASGSSSLVLPFWDWTNHRELPAPFRDTTPGNPLFIAQRNSAVNNGSLLPASAVSYSAAFAQVPFTNFSSSLEGTPHGAVHVSVGGWMSVVPQAAQDPIFWLHHANIDRLWTLWLSQGGGRNDPTTAGWLNRKFSFFNEGGTQVSMSAKQTVKTCPDLGYMYENVGPIIHFNPKLVAGSLVKLIATADLITIEPESGGAVALGSQPAEVVFPLGRARDAIRRAVRSGMGRQYLSFDDIEITDPDGYYEVYLNPPTGKPLEFTDPSYVGNLVLFGIGPSAGASHANMTPAARTLEITGKLANAGLGAVNDDSKLRVVLVLSEPDGASAGKPQSARARIGKLRLLIAP